MNQTSPPVTVADQRDGTFIRRFRVDEPGEYELRLARYAGVTTAVFAACRPAVETPAPSRFMVV